MLLSSIILLLFSNALTIRRDKSINFSRALILIMMYCGLLTLISLYIKPLGNGVGLYGGLFNVTVLTQGFNVFIFVITGVVLILTGYYPRNVFSNNDSSVKISEGLGKYSNSSVNAISSASHDNDALINRYGGQFRIIEYALIISFVVCGAVFLIGTGDLISIFLSIELQSYGLYIICTIYRDSESATASGLTYFLLGGLSSCFILLGSGLLYSNSGTTNMENIYIITAISELELSSNSMNQLHYFNLALIIMSVGFLFKVSAAPFHFWSPDVYDGIPTIVTTFVAIIAKISVFIFMLELVYYTDYDFLSFYWKNVLIISSLLSLFVGSVLGLSQFRIKRLFAYSTISHVGFILLALSIDSPESIQSFVFYLLQYSISNLNAFLILVSVGFSFYLYTHEKQEKENNPLVDQDNSPVQLINQMKGYFYMNSYLSVSMAVTIFSFVGVPPMIGFFGKQMILSAALDNGYIFMALFAIITSVIGAGYYLNFVRQIYFSNHNYKRNIEPTSPSSEPQTISINSALTLAISVITLAIVSFMLSPSEWFNAMSIVALNLFKA